MPADVRLEAERPAPRRPRGSRRVPARAVRVAAGPRRRSGRASVRGAGRPACRRRRRSGRRGSRRASHGCEGRAVDEPRHRVVGDDRAELRMAVPGQPVGRAVAVAEPARRIAVRQQLVDVMEQGGRLDEPAIERRARGRPRAPRASPRPRRPRAHGAAPRAPVRGRGGGRRRRPARGPSSTRWYRPAIGSGVGCPDARMWAPSRLGGGSNGGDVAVRRSAAAVRAAAARSDGRPADGQRDAAPVSGRATGLAATDAVALPRHRRRRAAGRPRRARWPTAPSRVTTTVPSRSVRKTSAPCARAGARSWPAPDGRTDCRYRPRRPRCVGRTASRNAPVDEVRLP